MSTGRLAKWQILLTEFDFVYVTRTAMKTQALTNPLAENPIDDEYEPLKTYFPDEEINSIEEEIPDNDPVWKLYFDGAVNKIGVGIVAVLISPNGCHYPATS